MMLFMLKCFANVVCVFLITVVVIFFICIFFFSMTLSICLSIVFYIQEEMFEKKSK